MQKKKAKITPRTLPIVAKLANSPPLAIIYIWPKINVTIDWIGNSHAPCGRDKDQMKNVRDRDMISNSHAVWSVTFNVFRLFLSFINFNSHAPCGA